MRKLLKKIYSTSVRTVLPWALSALQVLLLQLYLAPLPVGRDSKMGPPLLSSQSKDVVSHQEGRDTSIPHLLTLWVSETIFVVIVAERLGTPKLCQTPQKVECLLQVQQVKIPGVLVAFALAHSQDRGPNQERQATRTRFHLKVRKVLPKGNEYIWKSVGKFKLNKSTFETNRDFGGKQLRKAWSSMRAIRQTICKEGYQREWVTLMITGSKTGFKEQLCLRVTSVNWHIRTFQALVTSRRQPSETGYYVPMKSYNLSQVWHETVGSNNKLMYIDKWNKCILWTIGV